MLSRPTRLCRLPEVEFKTGLKRSSIYALAKRHQFPKPVKLTAHASAWSLEAVEEWMANRVAISEQIGTVTAPKSQ
jgi:prophage regulatory protein